MNTRLPNEMWQNNIGDFLTDSDVKKLSCSHRFFSHIFNENYFNNRMKQFPEKYIANITNLFPAVTKAISHYLAKINKPINERINSWDVYSNYYVIYNKGSNRASWFLEIIQNGNLSTEFRILSLYVLLNESNGQQLKDQVKKGISKKLDKESIKESIKERLTEKHIQDVLIHCYSYTPEKLYNVGNALLERIHSSPLKIFRVDHDGYSFAQEKPFPFHAVKEKNFEKEFFSNAQEENSKCLVM